MTTQAALSVYRQGEEACRLCEHAEQAVNSDLLYDLPKKGEELNGPPNWNQENDTLTI